MLNVDSWKATKGASGRYSFVQVIRDPYDVDVYEFSKEIEDEGLKVSFNGSIFNVEDYGTQTDFVKSGNSFYILARPTKEKL